MQSIESIAIQAAIQGVVGFLIWYMIKRQVEQTDRNLEKSDAAADRMSAELRSLRDDKVAGLADELDREADKRKTIYQRLEGIELSYMSKAACEKEHRNEERQHQEFINAVLKLERNTVETHKLTEHISEMQREQISLGKDMAGLIARVETIESKGVRK